MRRELTDAQARDQAEQLRAYVERGGSAERWLMSKGFAPADDAAVLLATIAMDEERGVTDSEAVDRIKRVYERRLRGQTA